MTIHALAPCASKAWCRPWASARYFSQLVIIRQNRFGSVDFDSGIFGQAAWLAAHLDDLPGSGIVYALTVSAAEDTAALLRFVIAAVSRQEGGPPDRVAITYPANWGPFKVDVLRGATKLAEVAIIVTVASVGSGLNTTFTSVQTALK